MVLAAAVCSAFFISACGQQSETASLKRDFLPGIKEKTPLTEVYNSYSGSPYEGESLYVLDMGTDGSKAMEDWNDLPMSDDLNEFFYSKLGDSPSRAEMIGLPEVSAGKWSFVDRGRSEFSEMSAYNFSFCLFDSENGFLYYYKIDT